MLAEYAELYGRCTMAGGLVWVWGQHLRYSKGGGGRACGIAHWGQRWEVGSKTICLSLLHIVVNLGELVGSLRCRSGYYSHKRAGMAT